MMKNSQARLLIERNLQHFASQGIERKPGDVEACLQYRQQLSEEEQELFDTLLREGNFAGSAAELIEVYTGREKPLSQQAPPALANAS